VSATEAADIREDGEKDLHGQSIRQACDKDAAARSVAQVNAPALAAYAETKLGSHPPIMLAVNKGTDSDTR
jgi:ADP-ribosylglycohydrolase